jgi:hypothetical protein
VIGRLALVLSLAVISPAIAQTPSALDDLKTAYAACMKHTLGPRPNHPIGGYDFAPGWDAQNGGVDCPEIRHQFHDAFHTRQSAPAASPPDDDSDRAIINKALGGGQ